MKYLVYLLAVLLIASLIYQVNQKSINKKKIPYGSFFINKDSLITLSMDWQREYTGVHLHDLKNDQSINLGKGKLIEKCLPVYYNDTAILWTYDMSPEDKWAILNYRNFDAHWISEDDALILIRQSALIFKQPLMTEQSYDPAKLPDDVFLADNFQGAQYMVDNKGNAVTYQGKPVLIIQTGEMKKQSVNRFSRFHRHRLISFLVKKYYIGLYDERLKRFEWVIKCDEPNSPHHRTRYFDGVYRSNETEVILLTDDEIEKMYLDKGTMVKHRDLKKENKE
jgi:hypothetical protein